MTSWIKEKDRDEMHQHLDELLDLYGEVMITSQKDWDRNVSNNYVLKSEVDRLIREARLESRIEELNDFNSEIAKLDIQKSPPKIFQLMIERMNRHQDSIDGLSKQEVKEEESV